MNVFIIPDKVNREKLRRRNKRQADPLSTRYGHTTIAGRGCVARVYAKKGKRK